MLDKGGVPLLGPTTKLRQLFPSLIAPLPRLRLGEWHLNIAEEEEELYKLGLCATLLAPSSIDAWRTILLPSPDSDWGNGT